MSKVTRNCWLRFNQLQIQQPLIWRLSRSFPDVLFDIREAQVKPNQGMMAMTFEGDEEDVNALLDYLRVQGVCIESASIDVIPTEAAV